jgi:hypothetical protein
MILSLSSSAAGILLALFAARLATALSYSGNRSPRLTFNGLRNVDFNDDCQTAAVQPSASDRFSAWVRTREISADQGVRFGLQSPSEARNYMAWTDDVRPVQPGTQVELPGPSGKDVRERPLPVNPLPGAKFPSKIGGSAWISDLRLVPQSAENPKQ